MILSGTVATTEVLQPEPKSKTVYVNSPKFWVYKNKREPQNKELKNLKSKVLFALKH